MARRTTNRQTAKELALFAPTNGGGMTAVQLPEGLKDSPALRALVQRAEKEHSKQVDTQRTAVRKELDKLLVAREKQVTAEGEAKQKATARVEAAQSTLEETQEELRRVMAASFGAGTSFETQRARLEQELISSSDAAIAAFIVEMHALLDGARREIRSGEQATGKTNVVTNAPEVVVWSNSASVRHRMAAIKAAIATAEDLRLEVGIDVSKRLAELRSALPEIELQKVGKKS
jgi:hypothetical protein